MSTFLDWAFQLSLLSASLWLLLLHLITFALSLATAHLVLACFKGPRLTAPPDPLEAREVAYTGFWFVATWLITFLAWILWKQGIIVIRRDMGWRAWLDIPVLVLVMDFCMYLLHRLAHLPLLYPIHRLHHVYDRPRPLNLFVLNPLETIGFGLLWILVITLYPSSWLGIMSYMGINLAAGIMGHLGVEPFPGWWFRTPILRQVGTSTFHAQHHQDIHHNFGFYTLIWDRLFGTLAPGMDPTELTKSPEVHTR